MGQGRPKFQILYAKKYNSSEKYTTAGCVVGTNLSYAPASPHLAQQLAPATLFTIICHYHYYLYCHYHYYHPLIIVIAPSSTPIPAKRVNGPAPFKPCAAIASHWRSCGRGKKYCFQQFFLLLILSFLSLR